MIKRIFRSTLFVSLGILFSAILLIMGALYNYFTKVQREQLRTETALIAQGVSLEGKNYFENLNVSMFVLLGLTTRERFFMIATLMQPKWIIIRTVKRLERLWKKATVRALAFRQL